jgi:hypothetical protein
MNNIQDEVRGKIDAFVAELAGIVRQSALDAVRSALGDAKAPQGRVRAATVVTRRGGGAKRRAARRGAARVASQALRGAAVSRGRTRPGQKRDPKVLARLVERLASHISSNPGERIEQINKALGVPTKDLNLPIKKLLRTGRITSKGQKRSTTYHPK